MPPPYLPIPRLTRADTLFNNLDLITELLTKDDAAASQQATKSDGGKEAAAEPSAPASSRPATRLATRTITYTSLVKGDDAEDESDGDHDDEVNDEKKESLAKTKKKKDEAEEERKAGTAGKVAAKAPEVVSADASGPVVYCLCRAEDDGSMMILCETCEDWFHPRCVGLSLRAAKQLGDDDIPYLCPTCTGSALRLDRLLLLLLLLTMMVSCCSSPIYTHFTQAPHRRPSPRFWYGMCVLPTCC